MAGRLDALTWMLRHPDRFALRVFKGFRANQGLLLSGVVAYYSLLSLIPMFSLILVALTYFVDERRLLGVSRQVLEVMIPGQSDALVAEIATFLSHRDLVSGLGLLVMLFFSSFAFTTLENAMAVIFHHRVRRVRRHFLTSVLLPYLFIALLGVGLLLVTVISGLVQTARAGHLSFGGVRLELDAVGAAVVNGLGVLGLILMLTAIYLVLPRGKISFRHALLGGVIAGVLWEVTRYVLVWYFSTLSMVTVIYGSLATTIVALLSLEIAGMILLVGAQVIAEYERLGHQLAGEPVPPRDESSGLGRHVDDDDDDLDDGTPS